MIQVNIDQALVPNNCEVIPNSKGTAPGMYFEENGKIYVSMPGVPYEMKAMMENVALEKLNQLNIKRLDKFTPMRNGVGTTPQTEAATDASAKSLLPSIAHYIKKVF